MECITQSTDNSFGQDNIPTQSVDSGKPNEWDTLESSKPSKHDTFGIRDRTGTQVHVIRRGPCDRVTEVRTHGHPNKHKV